MPVSADWVETLRSATTEIYGSPFLGDEDDIGVISEATSIPGHPLHPGCCYVVGPVQPHTDKNLPRWSYMLILHTDNPVLECAGHDPLRLADASLVELDLWATHSLVQEDEDTLVWISIESAHRLELDEALKQHRWMFDNSFAPAPGM